MEKNETKETRKFRILLGISGSVASITAANLSSKLAELGEVTIKFN
jgi:hypothetical protein